MTLYVDPDSPALKVLQNAGYNVEAGRSKSLDKRAIRLLFINQMPSAVIDDTVRQWGELAANARYDIHVTFAEPAGLREKPSGYPEFNAVRANHYDGLIVTGAGAENTILENNAHGRDPYGGVRTWASMQQIFKWAQKNVCGQFLSCLAGSMELSVNHGVAPTLSEDKRSGIYDQEVMNPKGVQPHVADLIKELQRLKQRPQGLKMPVSRHFSITKQAIQRLKMHVLLRADDKDTGLTVSKNGRNFYLNNHFEYDWITLFKEYERDLAASAKGELKYGNGRPKTPRPLVGCDDSMKTRTDTPPWREIGQVCFDAWLNGLNAGAGLGLTPKPPAQRRAAIGDGTAPTAAF